MLSFVLLPPFQEVAQKYHVPEGRPLTTGKSSDDYLITN